MRESGILMHITSLPGAYGVGTMGSHAHDFVDFLKQAGQSYWQILPLTVTGYGDSPYQSCSTFAGNHYLIDLQQLVDEGLLEEAELTDITWDCRNNRVDYGLLYQNRLNVLRRAYARFEGGAEFNDFCGANGSWLPDFALFMALKDEKGGEPWYQWEHSLKFREPDAIWEARQRLREQIRFYSFVQFVFFHQWNELRAYAHKQGVRIIGDVPIYVPLDSADVWSSPELFQLTGVLDPTGVAGCPPDAFTADGQLWGNPLYRWDAMAQDGYSWWIRRLAAAGKLYDVVRMDHFRGLESYWVVPYGDKTARGGKWVKGPGLDFINAVKTQLPQLNLIAEDLGYLTQEVLDLRDASGFPGMKVLEFAFDPREPSNYLPHNYNENCICYTGTHDNETLMQFCASLSPESEAYARDYLCIGPEDDLASAIIDAGMQSKARLFVAQMQDYLRLGAEARMNEPGKLQPENWRWRMLPGAASDELARKIAGLTNDAKRV